ncbi:MAG: hypothetical protein ABL958_11210 [Bdellovibrionia bacterium]
MKTFIVSLSLTFAASFAGAAGCPDLELKATEFFVNAGPGITFVPVTAYIEVLEYYNTRVLPNDEEITSPMTSLEKVKLVYDTDHVSVKIPAQKIKLGPSEFVQGECRKAIRLYMNFNANEIYFKDHQVGQNWGLVPDFGKVELELIDLKNGIAGKLDKPEYQIILPAAR